MGIPLQLRTDQELIEAARGQDLEAFDEFMRRHQSLVHRVAIHFVHDPEAAFDITQTAFLKAFQGLGRFRFEASVRTWLLRIAYNESIDWLRKHRHGGRHEPLEDASPFLAVDPAQDRALLAADDQTRIAQAMTGLSERYRLAVVLRYFQGLGVAEIAQVLGCSEGVTRNMLFRSIRTLRAVLSRT